MRNKSGSILHTILIHLILIGMIFAFFLISAESKFGSRGVKQQVLEKELALLVDASCSGMSFSVSKLNLNGVVDSVSVSNGRVCVGVDGFPCGEGYPYFSDSDVSVESDETKFVIRVK